MATPPRRHRWAVRSSFHERRKLLTDASPRSRRRKTISRYGWGPLRGARGTTSSELACGISVPQQ